MRRGGGFGNIPGHPHAVGDEGFAGLGEHGFGCTVVGDASVGTKHDNAVHMLRPHAYPVFDAIRVAPVAVTACTTASRTC